ncbi:methionine ABC transporter permease [Fructilactobacillus fructivorans]|uniref:ABC transporter permease subunit n=1 Tax=Fructilactobacillus fructivorans TaxID=1614 RepID=A0A0C1M7C7_9LACO|nr:methionine ABC transporter permease [Fructilactobacillus fructivorans]KID42304.1 Methionine ABC transporter permease protein [Fructilactobacillus fructivorans]KRK58203.1 ABC-type metal ion transport system, permease component [Fructilactobacillus fructivorans]KRN42609.1 ABC-type metal ion transport system, permease component [Fructilactobacillus fructivorans]MCT0151077.1 ABC transporter permease [Fructilactobacillus fructivorans]MCT2867365.1 ABC transporter permease [Fructilactobacillus fru
MGAWFATHFPNVVSQGLNGEEGWITAVNQTIYMTFWSAIFGGIAGIIFGVCLVIFADNGIMPCHPLFWIIDKVVSLFRAVPFIILLAFIAPVTQKIVGTQIGTTAALVPLSVGVFPFYARQVQVALESVDHGIIESAESLGATNWDLIFGVYLSEARSELIRVSTVTLISLVGLTAMAGAIGAGGLGNMAISYGYNRFANDTTLVATILVVIMVLIIQVVGDVWAKFANHADQG